MLKNRLIAVILIRDGQVVQSVKFKHTNVIHYDPIHAIESFNLWAIDEIVVLNVGRTEESKQDYVRTINAISEKCFVPMTAGGWITDLDYAKEVLANGADKIVVNTFAFLHPEFIDQLAQKLGSQCVIVSIDSKRSENGDECVAIDRGRRVTERSTVQWARQAEKMGAGELFINSIDFDGNRNGYNLPLIKAVAEEVSIPVISMGGVLKWEHLEEGVTVAGADAVAAANIFHYTEHSTKKAKKYLLEKGFKFRSI